jgi:P4 family phage/plasmid primase-like protien
MADGGDPVGGESFSQWVADSQAQNPKKRAGSRSSCFTLTEAGPGNGVSPDARQQAYLGKVLQNKAKTVAEARDGGRNNAVFSAALQCGSFVAGAGMDESALAATLEAAADKCGLVEDDGPKQVLDTIRSGLQRGKQNPRAVPPGSSGGPAEDSRSDGDGLQRLEDAHIGQRIADDCLTDRFLYSAAFGWMRYDGRRWKPVDDTMVGEVVRQGLIEFHRNEAQAGADADRLKRISGLLSAHKLKAILWVAKCYLSVEDADFDAHPDLLNVRNGVVDLRDGSLRPHDPVLRFTKVTMVDYVPDAVHPDWEQALTAVPNDAVDWMHVRLGQGLTGYPAPDDVLVVLKGSGENGKSTLLDSVLETVGLDYAVPLPDRVLLARNGDHPTELMTLRGARLAFMEEFPEIGHLNVKRLKATQGTFQMSARYIGKDTVCWTATHTMFVTTNYLPRVDESDHGTWRRLALVDFPFRYRKPHEILLTDTDRPGDPGLRDRMRRGGDGRSEAVLSWLIKGAVNWYHNERMMPPAPPSVLEATHEWRRCSDLLLRYMEDHLVFDANAHVMARELFVDFTWWLKANGHVGWTDQNFSSRLAQHPDVLAAGVGKKRGVRSACPGLSRHRNYEFIAPKQYAAWMGLRFRVPEDAQGGGGCEQV